MAAARPCSKEQAAANGGSVLRAHCAAHSGASVRQSFAVSVRGSPRAARRSQSRQPWQTSGAPSVATRDP
eukprot:6087572-Pyramimonas_sp.AAC.1